MSRFRDLPAAVFGRLGEQLASRALKNINVGVIATFKFSGENDNEAPAMEFHDKRVVIPDFDASKDRRRFWLELKTYKEPQWNRSHRCLVHGVATRLVDEYLETERQSGTPVYLGVLEVDSGSLMVSNVPMSELTKYTCSCGCEGEATTCEYRSKWGNSYPQWYFRRDQFVEWLKLGESEHAKLKAAHEKVSHSIRRHGPAREPARPGAFASKQEPWTWACLPCNTVGRDDKSKAAHRCPPGAPDYRHVYDRKLAYVLSAMPKDERGALIARPVARDQIVAWFGPQWSPEGDSGGAVEGDPK